MKHTVATTETQIIVGTHYCVTKKTEVTAGTHSYKKCKLTSLMAPSFNSYLESHQCNNDP